jgi:hypothetical protein
LQTMRQSRAGRIIQSQSRSVHLDKNPEAHTTRLPACTEQRWFSACWKRARESRSSRLLQRGGSVLRAGRSQCRPPLIKTACSACVVSSCLLTFLPPSLPAEAPAAAGDCRGLQAALPVPGGLWRRQPAAPGRRVPRQGPLWAHLLQPGGARGCKKPGVRQ